MPAEAHVVPDRLKQPIPLPEAFDEKKATVKRLALKKQRANAFRSMAEVCQLPQWTTVRETCRKVVDTMLDQLPEARGEEKDQLIGQIKAWRHFTAAPEQALEEVRRLDLEIDEIEKMLRKGNEKS